MIVDQLVIKQSLSVGKVAGVPDDSVSQFLAMAKTIAIQADPKLHGRTHKELDAKVNSDTGNVHVTPIGRNWAQYGKTWDEFVADDLNDAGVQVDVEGKKFLIGNINMLGGYCDDCCEFRGLEIVTRYRRLVEERELND
jgi:hypothetical protein